tara:strand:+ start:11968 stop:13305 length:1338 start_codon:yes stop_codon:yes gene_type:complete
LSDSSPSETPESGQRRLPTYDTLQQLWSGWLTQPKHSLLDRWLKAEAAHWRKRRGRPLPLSLSQGIFHAERFRQLACALELIQRQGMEQDWDNWDAHWLPDMASDVSRNAFWFWIQCRTGSNWAVPDDFHTGARQTLFDNVSKAVKQEPLSPLWLLWHGVRPQWLAQMRKRAEVSGWNDEQLQAFISRQSSQPSVWLRLRPGTDEDALFAELRAADVRVFRSEQGFELRGGKGIHNTDAYRNGLIDMQDLSSQQIVQAVNPQSGEKIWDTCAGAGGKSLAMAAQMGRKGVVVATDLHQYKLDELKRRAKKAEQLNIRTFVWDGEAPLRLPAEVARQQGFDKVLVDAPCSASGTWRRNPDARWRFDGASLAELTALQQKLLTLASQSVRSGGQLIYATCSWLTEENEDVVGAFLAANYQYQLQSSQILGVPATDSDSMFVAVLQRS